MAFTFDQSHYTDHVSSLSRFLLVVSSIVGNVRLMKVLMDSGQ
jgi:hypothetical protein